MDTVVCRAATDYAALDFFALSTEMIEEMMTDPNYLDWSNRQAHAAMQEHAARDEMRELHAACEEG
jgi:hypothetical protein